MQGRQPGPNSVRLDSNDYLGLANHPDIVRAQVEALQRGDKVILPSNVMLPTTNHPAVALETALAHFVGKQEGVLCPSGYAANSGLVQAIVDRDTPVYMDASAHASMWEGIRMAQATGHIFRHNDVGHLDELMGLHGPGLVIVDSVYSLTGALCPLHDIVYVSERHGSMLLVDESHSLGTHGWAGAGLCASLGLTDRVHFITASLAKAFVGRAGFFTLPPELRDYVRGEHFPLIFSSCLLPHEVAGLAATLEVIRHSDAARERLRAVTRRLRASLTALGYPLHQGSEHILALEAGPEPATLALRDELEAREVYGSVFCPPATSRKRSLVRLSLNATLTDAEVQHVEEVARELAPRLRP